MIDQPAADPPSLESLAESARALRKFFDSAVAPVSTLQAMSDADFVRWARDPGSPARLLGLREMLVGALQGSRGGLEAAESALAIARAQQRTLDGANHQPRSEASHEDRA